MFRVILALATAMAVTQLANLLTTVYLHRALSHRAVRLSPGVTGVIRPLIWMTTGIRPRQWVAVHRKHHAFADADGDPHSPLVEGFAAVQLGNVLLYRKALRDPSIIERYARDLPADRWDRLLFDHAFVGLSIGVTMLCAVFGLWIGLFAAALHTVTYLGLSSAINAIGHWRGTQPYPNKARNNQWLAWLTSGEGFHNNHHAAPTSARLALSKGEIDPGWWLVRLLERCGWATLRHHEVHLKVTAGV